MNLIKLLSLYLIDYDATSYFNFRKLALDIPQGKMYIIYRGGSRTAATSKMESFVIIVNGWKPLTIITKCSILDVAAVVDPPLI